MSAFDDATAVRAEAPGRYEWSVPDGWQQGRGAWGGLVVGAMARAVVASETQPRALRTVTAQIMSPAVVGEHIVEVTLVRGGSAMSTWTVRVSDGSGAPVATMVAITGSPRVADASDHADWGTVTPPEAVAADHVDRLAAGGPLPVFTQHIDMRPLSATPFAAGPAETVGWVGFAEPTQPSEVSLLALVDAWWPASLPLLDVLPRFATVSFMATLLLEPAALRPGDLLLHQAFVAGASEGFTSEHRRLWSSDGHLVVDNMQTIVVGS